jgi:hypothetical protein
MSIDDARRTTTRRDFARTALLAALMAPACASLPAPAGHPGEGAADAARPGTADALFAVLLERHGRHLDAGQRVRVRRDVDAYLRAAERLRAVPLDPATEPALVFRVLRGEG